MNGKTICHLRILVLSLLFLATFFQLDPRLVLAAIFGGPISSCNSKKLALPITHVVLFYRGSILHLKQSTKLGCLV